MNFDEAFERLIGNEGGYVSPEEAIARNDPGGETNWGLSKRSYPDLDIKSITCEQAKAIYQRDFWQPLGAAPDAVKFQAFDFAVNSGIQTAIRKLQAAIGVADDGHWGPVSAAKLASMDLNDVIMRYVAQRLRFWASLSNWKENGKGWALRAARDLEYASEDN